MAAFPVRQAQATALVVLLTSTFTVRTTAVSPAVPLIISFLTLVFGPVQLATLPAKFALVQPVISAPNVLQSMLVD